MIIQNKFLVIFILGMIILIIAMAFLPKHVFRYFYWNYADLNDHKKFQNLEIGKGENTFRFQELIPNMTLVIPEKFNKGKTYHGFEDFLEKKEVVAFLIVHDDTLIYEKYFDKYGIDSVIPSFSVAKAFVSALVGIAIDEGYIENTSQPVTYFIKELKSPEFDRITIEDLLNMRSGIRFNEGYGSPFADMAKYYYGTDLEKYITRLKIREAPNRSYDYISVNILLLSLIVERATKTKLNVYCGHKLWKPLGMEFDASWSIDSPENNTIKSFCCLNARARDFAKFGRLYLNGGNWNGARIISEQWIKRSTSIINDSRDSQGYPYTYQWRVLENGAFFAKGILGQYIFVYPEKKLIFVRMGNDYADIDWARFFLELSEQI
jgi:CubicO group peptidase (beta-lactamase class C family)